MLNILLMIILIIIIFFIILLYLGVKIVLNYDKSGSELKGCLKILILKKIKVYSVDFPKEKDNKKDSDDESEHEKRDIKKLLKLAKPCLGYFKEFLKSTIKCFKISKLDNHLVFGLDSYADTAKYIGYIWSVCLIVNGTHENAKLTAEPSFTGSIIDVKGNNELEINLLKLVPPAIKLISKKEVRTLIKGVRNG